MKGKMLGLTTKLRKWLCLLVQSKLAKALLVMVVAAAAAPWVCSQNSSTRTSSHALPACTAAKKKSLHKLCVSAEAVKKAVETPSLALVSSKALFLKLSHQRAEFFWHWDGWRRVSAVAMSTATIGWVRKSRRRRRMVVVVVMTKVGLVVVVEFLAAVKDGFECLLHASVPGKNPACSPFSHVDVLLAELLHQLLDCSSIIITNIITLSDFVALVSCLLPLKDGFERLVHSSTPGDDPAGFALSHFDALLLELGHQLLH